MNQDAVYGQAPAYLDHARDRMAQRGITCAEVEEALLSAAASGAAGVDGKIRLIGSTAAGRPLAITRLAGQGAVVSVVCLRGRQP